MSSILQIDTNVRQAIADAIISDKLNNFKRDNEGGIWLKYDALYISIDKRGILNSELDIVINFYLNGIQIADVKFANIMRLGDSATIQGIEGYIPIHIT